MIWLKKKIQKSESGSVSKLFTKVRSTRAAAQLAGKPVQLSEACHLRDGELLNRAAGWRSVRLAPTGCCGSGWRTGGGGGGDGGVVAAG